MLKRPKILLAVFFTCSLGIGAYWYYSPYLAVKEIKSSADARDIERFNEFMDYPRIHENLKTQLASAMSKKILKEGSNGIEAIGLTIAFSVFEPMIDASIQPESILNTVQSGEFWPPKPINTDSNGFTLPPQRIEWEFNRINVDKMSIRPQSKKTTNNNRGEIILERTSFSNWKVTDFRLPLNIFEWVINGKSPKEVFYP